MAVILAKALVIVVVYNGEHDQKVKCWNSPELLLQEAQDVVKDRCHDDPNIDNEDRESDHRASQVPEQLPSMCTLTILEFYPKQKLALSDEIISVTLMHITNKNQQL